MEGIKLAELTSCTCRGFTAVYECTVMGGLVTIWRGNAINCENSAAGMLLLHNRFGTSDRDYTKTCNNGTISGRGARVSGVFYTSQLRVNISLDLIGKTIECASFNNSSQSIIINATTSKYKAAGSGVYSSLHFLCHSSISITEAAIFKSC